MNAKKHFCRVSSFQTHPSFPENRVRMLSTALFINILELLEETEYRINGPGHVGMSPPGTCDGSCWGLCEETVKQRERNR